MNFKLSIEQVCQLQEILSVVANLNYLSNVKKNNAIKLFRHIFQQVSEQHQSDKGETS